MNASSGTGWSNSRPLSALNASSENGPRCSAMFVAPQFERRSIPGGMERQKDIGEPNTAAEIPARCSWTEAARPDGPAPRITTFASGLVTLEASLHDQVRRERELCEPRPQLARVPNRVRVGTEQRPDVRTETRALRGNIEDPGRQVGEQPQPRDAGPRAAGLDRLGQLVLVEGRREVHARGLAQRVVAPRPRVDVEQLELIVAVVVLVLELDEAVVADTAQQLDRVCLERLLVDRLDVRARASELPRVLAAPARVHGDDRLAVLEEGAVGVLAVAAARNQLLDHGLAVTHDRVRAAGEAGEGVA